jgi:hypothetical protein
MDLSSSEFFVPRIRQLGSRTISFVLPVEAGLGTSYGDGLATVAAANAQNQYNLTIIEPSFAIDPWYANNPNDANLQYETFMASELEPWVKAMLTRHRFSATTESG